MSDGRTRPGRFRGQRMSNLTTRSDALPSASSRQITRNVNSSDESQSTPKVQNVDRDREVTDTVNVGWNDGQRVSSEKQSFIEFWRYHQQRGGSSRTLPTVPTAKESFVTSERSLNTTGTDQAVNDRPQCCDSVSTCDVIEHPIETKNPSDHSSSSAGGRSFFLGDDSAAPSSLPTRRSSGLGRRGILQRPVSRVYIYQNEAEDYKLLCGGCCAPRKRKRTIMIFVLFLVVVGVAFALALSVRASNEEEQSVGSNNENNDCFRRNECELLGNIIECKDAAHGQVGCQVQHEQDQPPPGQNEDGFIEHDDFFYPNISPGFGYSKDSFVPSISPSLSTPPSSSPSASMLPSSHPSLSLSPSTSPSSSPSSTRYHSMLNRVLKTTNATMLTPNGNTPQYRALQYLAYDDPSDVRPEDDSFLPRYFLTVLYFSTGGEGWTSSEDWLIRTDICEWEGVTCQLHLHNRPREKQVTGLDLANHNLSGSIPSEVGYFKFLDHLVLCNNDLTGKVPENIGHLDRLNNITLSRNALDGQIPTSVGKLSNLRLFHWNENDLSGVVPTEIGHLENLEELDLYGNRLHGDLPTQLGNLIKLRRIWASGNEISGVIPCEIGRLSNLRFLYLDDNLLRGRLPSTLGNVTTLEDIRLYSNALTGKIPDAFENLVNMRILYWDKNKLTGTLPSWMGRVMTDLEFLDLSGNRLSGSIPTELGNLTKLIEMRLYQNDLTGFIPTTFTKLISLVELRLEQNDINGTLPESLCTIGIGEISVDCIVTCACCSYCREKKAKEQPFLQGLEDGYINKGKFKAQTRIEENALDVGDDVHLAVLVFFGIGVLAAVTILIVCLTS